ncbi:hypothetical protein ACFLQU_00950 [Verrucomicrobiota bacterium]
MSVGVKIACPSCSANLELDGADGDWGDQTIACPECNANIVVPAALHPHAKTPGSKSKYIIVACLAIVSVVVLVIGSSLVKRRSVHQEFARALEFARNEESSEKVVSVLEEVIARNPKYKGAGSQEVRKLLLKHKGGTAAINVADLLGKRVDELSHVFPELSDSLRESPKGITSPAYLCTIHNWSEWKLLDLEFDQRRRLTTFCVEPVEPISEDRAKEIVTDTFGIPLPEHPDRRAPLILAYDKLDGGPHVGCRFVSSSDRRIESILIGRQ